MDHGRFYVITRVWFLTLPFHQAHRKRNTMPLHIIESGKQLATVYHIKGKENVADILTKPTDGPTFRKHVKAVFMKL